MGPSCLGCLSDQVSLLPTLHQWFARQFVKSKKPQLCDYLARDAPRILPAWFHEAWIGWSVASEDTWSARLLWKWGTRVSGSDSRARILPSEGQRGTKSRAEYRFAQLVWLFQQPFPLLQIEQRSTAQLLESRETMISYSEVACIFGLKSKTAGLFNRMLRYHKKNNL